MSALFRTAPALRAGLRASAAKPIAAMASTTFVRGKATLPDLAYDYGALEPYINGTIMELHHSKHHQTYVNGLNSATAINEDFGSFEALKKQTNAALAGIQGSGWAWLVKDKSSGTLGVVTRLNQDPVTGNLEPLLGIDAWEHAYYLQYQNRKAEYFSAIWEVVNWGTVAKRFEK
ncbi:unnamed protein product [Clonostachys rosea f. rosea IK726]|uniref:superoxide dismutase n=2 Tax=Bionectria ochroleuca TaxID=29856 RepID=A0A0B7JI26_BIOOC|nr:unnamed protein product [Clonostachys rosea f. rosea IK726]